ncbi:MAG: hypothetical protein ACLS7Z_02045 [Christensenellales bacterium]
MVFYENGKKFVKEESYAWNEKEIYASDHLDWENSFQEIKELNGADIDVNKEIKYVNIVNNLALVVFEKDNLNNGKIHLLYSVDGRFLYGYQITPKMLREFRWEFWRRVKKFVYSILNLDMIIMMENKIWSNRDKERRNAVLRFLL